MNNIFLETITFFTSGLFFGGLLFLFYLKFTERKRERAFKEEKDRILNRAKSQAAKIERLSKEKAKDWEEKEIKRVQKENKALEENLKNQEENLKKRQDQIDMELQAREEEIKRLSVEMNQEKELLEVSRKQVDDLKAKVQKEHKEVSSSLEKLAVMSEEEAKAQLKKAFEEDIKKEISHKLLKVEEEMTKKP